MSIFKLFLIFVKIGAIALGGGYVILPIMTSEFVDKRNLLTSEEMLDYFALAQSLPGIIATNISMFIGYHLKGKFGAMLAMIGVTFVPFWAIVLLASIIGNLINNSYVQSALWGIGIAVIALIMLTLREMWQKSTKNIYFYTVFTLTLLSLIFLKLSPIQAILTFTILGVGYKKFMEAK